MSGPWIVAVLALWVVVVLLALLTLGLLRRLAPVLERAERTAAMADAMHDVGLPDGAAVPPFAVLAPDGRTVPFADVGPADRVVLFVDANCPACGTVTAELAADPAGAALPLVVVPGASTPPDHYRSLTAAGITVVGQSDGAASQAFRQRAFPLAFAVAAGGKVVTSTIPSGLADLRALAERLPPTEAPHPTRASDGTRAPVPR